MRRGTALAQFVLFLTAILLLIILIPIGLVTCASCAVLGVGATAFTDQVSPAQKEARANRDNRARLQEYEDKLKRIDDSVLWYDRVIIEAYDNGSLAGITDDAIRVNPHFLTFSRKEQNIIAYAVWERDQSWAFPHDDEGFATNTLYKFDIIDDATGEIIMAWTHTGEIGELSDP